MKPLDFFAIVNFAEPFLSAERKRRAPAEETAMLEKIMEIVNRIPSILAILFIAGYLIVGRSQWFSELLAQAEIGMHPIYSQNIDLSKTGKFKWKLPRESWIFRNYREGELILSLILDRKKEIPFESYQKEIFPLKLKVTAYAKTKDGKIFNRLVQNWYFKTDEPFKNKDNIVGSSWGEHTVSYTLAGINLYSFEETYIEIDVLEPDLSLSQTNPRIKIVGSHDYAIYGPLPMIYFIRDGGLFLCLFSLLVLWMKLNKEKEI